MTDGTAELVAGCLLQLRTGTSFGTGFFVAERTVVTCAHVVDGAKEVSGLWRGQEITGRVLRAFPEHRDEGHSYGLPDIAVIEFGELGPHPSVWLADPGQGLREGQAVTAHGFSTHGVNAPDIGRDARQLTVGAHLDLECLRVKDDNLPMGMSGSPVIDELTGRVGGFVKASADHGGVHPAGGWIVSVAALYKHAPWLVEANRRASAPWREAVDRADPDRNYLDDLLQRDTRPVVDPEIWAPSYYLEPQQRIVEFLPRPELRTLEEWCRRSPRGIVRVVQGPGGAGKTRLGLQLADSIRDSEWSAGCVDYAPDVHSEQLVGALDGRKVLLCIDNAEDWAFELPTLLSRIGRIRHEHVRVLLLARTVGGWWQRLRSDQGVRTLIGPEPLRLRPLDEQVDRTDLLHGAYRDFRRRICPAAPEDPPPVLLEAVPRERGVLGLHAAALAVVLHFREHGGRSPTEMPDLSDPLSSILDHERARWDGWFRSEGLVPDRDDTSIVTSGLSDRVLLVPTLYPASDETQAKMALEGVLADGGYPVGQVGKVATALHSVYPSTRAGEAARYWDPPQPDRLGETLVLEALGAADDTERCVELMCSIFDGGVDEVQAEQALTVLTRASGLAASPPAIPGGIEKEVALQRAVDCVRALLRRFPDTFVPAAATVTARFAEPDRMIAVIVGTLSDIPGGAAYEAARRIADSTGPLASLVAALLQRSVDQEQSRGLTAAQGNDLANLYSWLGEAREQSGEPGAALDAARFAVRQYLQAIAGGFRGARIHLASTLETLSERNSAAEDHDGALEEISRAVAIYRELLDEGQDCQRHLARAVGSQDRIRRKMGRNSTHADEPQPATPRPSFDDPGLRVVFPVGHFAGPMYTEKDAETPESFEIRFREGVFSLNAEEYALWAVAHGNPEFVSAIPTTRAVIEHAASAVGVSDPEPVFDSLVDDGLLVQVPFAAGTAGEFARRYQVMPLALGLGNTPRNPAEFQIGLPNAPRASVGYDVYHMWLFVHRAPTLWDAIQQIADEAREANEEDGPDDRSVMLVDDPDTLLTALLRALPILISTSCVFLERPG